MCNIPRVQLFVSPGQRRILRTFCNTRSKRATDTLSGACHFSPGEHNRRLVFKDRRDVIVDVAATSRSGCHGNKPFPPSPTFAGAVRTESHHLAEKQFRSTESLASHEYLTAYHGVKHPVQQHAVPCLCLVIIPDYECNPFVKTVADHYGRGPTARGWNFVEFEECIRHMHSSGSTLAMPTEFLPRLRADTFGFR